MDYKERNDHCKCWWDLKCEILSDVHARNYHESLDAAEPSYLNKVMGNYLQYDNLGQHHLL